MRKGKPPHIVIQIWELLVHRHMQIVEFGPKYSLKWENVI